MQLKYKLDIGRTYRKGNMVVKIDQIIPADGKSERIVVYQPYDSFDGTESFGLFSRQSFFMPAMEFHDTFIQCKEVTRWEEIPEEKRLIKTDADKQDSMMTYMYGKFEEDCAAREKGDDREPAEPHEGFYRKPFRIHYSTLIEKDHLVARDIEKEQDAPCADSADAVDALKYLKK